MSNLIPLLILFQMWNPKRIVKSIHPYNPPIKVCTALRRSKVCLFFCHRLWSLGLTQKEGLRFGNKPQTHPPGPSGYVPHTITAVLDPYSFPQHCISICVRNVIKSYRWSFSSLWSKLQTTFKHLTLYYGHSAGQAYRWNIECSKSERQSSLSKTNFGILFSFNGSS